MCQSRTEKCPTLAIGKETETGIKKKETETEVFGMGI
jgi:hypothetical protein